MIIVDDRLLFDVLAGTESVELLHAASDGVATTFSWYYRLARAIATGRIEGSLTRHYGDLTAERQRHVSGLLNNLADRVEIIAPKEVVPVMAALATVANLNVLTAEAIASSMVLEAPIHVATRSARLDRAAQLAGVEVRLTTHATRRTSALRASAMRCSVGAVGVVAPRSMRLMSP